MEACGFFSRCSVLPFSEPQFTVCEPKTRQASTPQPTPSLRAGVHYHPNSLGLLARACNSAVPVQASDVRRGLMGAIQTRVGFGSSRDLGIPNNTMRASLLLAECLGMQKGWGYLNFRQQSPLSLGLVECLALPPASASGPRPQGSFHGVEAEPPTRQLYRISAIYNSRLSPP